jgi:hypothetical protein
MYKSVKLAAQLNVTVLIKVGYKEPKVYELQASVLTQPVASTQQIVELSKLELASGNSPLILQSQIKHFPFHSNY